ncbi:MAG TPA: glycosyltransferase family 10 [Burkholderiaceae bacterium]|nr:glycosyltransferase family 10 [Burkholderiaceae bacterium]
MSRSIYIDPSYPEFGQDRLFSLDDPVLNRDDQLLPFHRLRTGLLAAGHRIHTADRLFEGEPESRDRAEYYSLGVLRDYGSDAFRGVALKAFVIMEPTVVAPDLYAALPKLTRRFERVYLHNTRGDGYSLVDVDASRLRRLYWPMPFADVLPAWGNPLPRQPRLVLINGKHLPRGRPGELYGTRIDAMLALGEQGHLDLFGRGWDRWRDKRWLLRPGYWSMRRRIASIYKGACESKYEVLSRYAFCLCFENMTMDGYISEKILDCFLAGTVPVYLGAPNIREFVPADAFVDARRFGSWEALWQHVSALAPAQVERMREAGAAFVRSAAARPFFTSINDVISGRDPAP